jgi:hypothetical protein
VDQGPNQSRRVAGDLPCSTLKLRLLPLRWEIAREEYALTPVRAYGFDYKLQQDEHDIEAEMQRMNELLRALEEDDHEPALIDG